MMKMILKNEKTGVVITKKIADGNYNNIENLAKGIIKGWARKNVRAEWISSGKLLSENDVGDFKFADGFNSSMMKNAISEFEKNVSWKLEEA